MSLCAPALSDGGALGREEDRLRWRADGVSLEGGGPPLVSEFIMASAREDIMIDELYVDGYLVGVGGVRVNGALGLSTRRFIERPFRD